MCFKVKKKRLKKLKSNMCASCSLRQLNSGVAVATGLQIGRSGQDPPSALGSLLQFFQSSEPLILHPDAAISPSLAWGAVGAGAPPCGHVRRRVPGEGPVVAHSPWREISRCRFDQPWHRSARPASSSPHEAMTRRSYVWTSS